MVDATMRRWDRGRRSRRIGAVVATSLMGIGAAAACTPPGQPSDPLPCTRTSLVETATPIASTGVTPPALPPDVEFGYDPRPVTEELSDNGVIHVWVVGELFYMGLGHSAAIKRLHVYAEDTTTGETPIEVYRVQTYAGHRGLPGLGDPDGYPVAANVDAIFSDGTSAAISVTYGKRYDLLADGGYISAPYESSVHRIEC